MSRKRCVNYMRVEKKHLLSLLLCAFCTHSLSAQVTVGTDEPAEKAALFQIKNIKELNPVSVTDISNVSVDKNGGGLALPRVQLKSKTTLEPFVETTDADWIAASVSKIKEKHAGLMVYNLTTTGDFKQGVYVWDGMQWNINGDGESSPPIDAWLKSGNAGTTTGTHFVGTTDAQGLAFKTNNAERMRISSGGNVGVGTTNPLATLHVEGDMILTNTPQYSNANVLVIDNNGAVGIAAPEAPISKVLYVQSASIQKIEGAELTKLNSGDAIVVQWAATDILSHGGLLTYNSSDNTFTFNEKALCEVSGYINYLPNATVPTTYTNDWTKSVAVLNVTVQFTSSTAPTSWEDLTGARLLCIGSAAGGVIQTINVPPAIRTFSKNDKIRLIIKRPSSLGLQHGSTVNYSSITIPTGSSFSKGMKVTTM